MGSARAPLTIQALAPATISPAWSAFRGETLGDLFDTVCSARNPSATIQGLNDNQLQAVCHMLIAEAKQPLTFQALRTKTLQEFCAANPSARACAATYDYEAARAAEYGRAYNAALRSQKLQGNTAASFHDWWTERQALRQAYLAARASDGEPMAADIAARMRQLR